MIISLFCYNIIVRAGPGVSPASPWASATPHPKATNEKINKYYEYMMIF
jgi:hypothetical protein